MRMRIAATVVMSLAAASCQNAGYMMDTYNKVGKQSVSIGSATFWVFDRPDLKKIMTSPTPGSMLAPSVVSGATLGAVKVDPLVQAHQNAALQYLSSTGRACDLKTSSEIWRPNYEHTYSCR